MGDIFPTIKAAVVQAASILYDREKSLAKAESLIAEAADSGARLVAFPESFIPGYPYHLWAGTPEWYQPLFREWFLNGVEVPGPTTDVLCGAARRHNIDVVIGVNERDGRTCYNTQLFIKRDGCLLGKHRKLMPTHVERAHWGMGDGSTLRSRDFDTYRLSGLICFEHSMDLARQVVIAEQSQIHVASWVGGSAITGFWEQHFDPMSDTMSKHHAIVGGAFVLNAQGTLDEQGYQRLSLPGSQARFLKPGGGFSSIIAPGGAYLAGPLHAEEGILYAELDLNAIAAIAHWHDEVGHYARPDILSLSVNREPYHVTRPMAAAG